MGERITMIIADEKMNDKELLEFAAKATGIKELYWESDGTVQNRMNVPTIPYHVHGMMTGIVWNPLTNDGEALRLAVKLSLWIGVQETCVTVSDNYGRVPMVDEEYISDPYAATRRAIVRIAAEIGKRMK